MNLEYTQMQMNLRYFKDNFTLETLMSGDFILQLLIIAAVVFLAFLAEYYLRKKFKNSEDNDFNLKDIFKIVRPIVMLLILIVAMYFFREGGYKWGLLYFANTVLVILLFARLAIILTRYIFKSGPWLRPVENILAGIVVIGYLSHQLGVVSKFQMYLHSIEFYFAEQDFTLLLVIESIFGVFIAIIVAMTVARFVENQVMKIKSQNLRINQKIILIKIFKIFLYLTAIIIVLTGLGIDLSFLTLFGGAFGLGLAFGFQKIASNYVSGFLLLSDESIRVGDMLQIGSDHGIVVAIKSRYTALRRLDGVEILIPNEKLLTDEITNLTFSNTTVKFPLDLQISYESSIDRAIEIILSVCAKESRVIEEPKPNVYVKEFADSGINLHVSCYVTDPAKGFMGLKSDMYRAIFKEFKSNEIEIPYPHRTMIMPK
ncbi:mechanosensitive ion channel [Methylophilaceae bacterium]|nr:mechanosensitive ion channel [Methylophilaceae bacterium]